jgi:hypothetical protein
MRLSTQVVNLIGSNFSDDASEVRGVTEVPVVEFKAGVLNMGVLIDVIDPLGIEGGCTTLDSMDLIAFLQEKLGEIRSVLPCDSCN